jgi:hypothetical protein
VNERLSARGARPQRRARQRCGAILLCGALVLNACSSETAATGGRGDGATGASAGILDLGGKSYTPREVSDAGTVAGKITLEGATRAEAESGSRRRTGARVCPSADSSSGSTGSGGTVVWISGVRSGKSFPVERRTEIAISECDVDPEIQAVVTGTAINVMNTDRVLHRFIVTRAGTHDTLRVMPFYNAGEVVASDDLAQAPGLLELRCAEHPQLMHGYVAVFGNPYFAVTESDGSFRIDSLPAGRYTVMAWRAGMKKPLAKAVDVASGGIATVELAAPATP